MIITLQLIKNQFIDTDEESGFSLKWTNPFFCVGVTNVSHTQDLSVPATENNNKIFNLDNIAIAEGWRHGRQCWMGYSGGELEGRLFIKDYEKGRYNLLFLYGAELDPIFEQPIADIWQPANSIYLDSPKLNPIPADFGWMEYNELHGGSNFGNGISMFPAINLGWMMDELATAANYSITIDGVVLSSVADVQYNPYNYGVSIDSLDIGTEYHLIMSSWAATGINSLNYYFEDDNSNPVQDSAAGFQLVNINIPSSTPNYPITVAAFQALRNVRLNLTIDSNVICLANAIHIIGSNPNFPIPNLSYNVQLDMIAGETVTFINSADYDQQYYGFLTPSTPLSYTVTSFDSMTTASIGDYVDLAQNLPDMTFLEIIRNYCLMTSSYYIIDSLQSTINIYTINNVVDNYFQNGRYINIESERKILSVGKLFRYIDGYSQHNLVTCESADYVRENQRFRIDYPCDNDLLDKDGDIGVITFNDGNYDISASSTGQAIFENVAIDSNNTTSLQPQVGIMFVNNNNQPAYHIRWVEENYNMSRGLAQITAAASSIILSIREYMFEFLEHDIEDIVDYGGRYWLVKNATWQDNVTQLELVSVDAALAVAFTPINYLRFTGNGTIYLRTKLNIDIEISQDGENFNPWAYEVFGGYRYYYTLTLSDGQTYYMRGNNPSGLADASNFSQFFMSGSIYAAGDIGTLINRTGGENLTVPDYAFKSLFSGCSSMLSAPELPFKDTGDYSCYQMFYNCSSLEQLITRMTANNGNDGTYQWLYGVAATGDFYCPQTLVIASNDPSGIPSGWTRHDI